MLGERSSLVVTFVDDGAANPTVHRLHQSSRMRFHYDDLTASAAIDDDRVTIMRASAASALGLLVPRAAHLR